MKKAQTATEYLIILAVVIIIALIVVGVMGGIPGMGGNAKAKTSAAYWSTAKVSFTSYSVNSAGATLNIRNSNAGSITITAVSLGGTALTMVPALPVTLTAGQTQQFTSVSKTCASGSFSFPVSVTYTEVDTGASITFEGDGQNLDGTCAN
jgi:hypothetical protein